MGLVQHEADTPDAVAENHSFLHRIQNKDNDEHIRADVPL